MDNKKKVIISIIGCALAFVIVLGITYAYWYLTKTQTGKNIITTGCLKMEFTENTGAITLTSAVPTSEEDGAKLDPYTFTIKNTCNSTEYYSINLETLNTTTLSDNYVRVKLNNDESKLLSALSTADTTLEDATSSRNIATGSLEANESKTLNLRLYLGGEEATDSNSMNKVFESKVVITGSLSDLKKQEPLYTVVNDVNVVGILDVGDEINITGTNENFYVISIEENMINALAKYNLYVGGEYNGPYTEYTDPTGIQNSEMMGFKPTGMPFTGATAYFDRTLSVEDYTVYSDSIIKNYVDNYMNYLNNSSDINAIARLITKEEVVELGCDMSSYSCSDAPEWLYSTSYWTSSSVSNYYVWTVRIGATFVNSSTINDMIYGVRPVITFSTN